MVRVRVKARTWGKGRFWFSVRVSVMGKAMIR